MDKIEPIKFMTRISPSLHERVVRLSKENKRSLNNQVVVILDAWFDADMLRKRLGELERSS